MADADYLLLQFPDQLPAPIPGELATIVDSAIVNSSRLQEKLNTASDAAIARQLTSSTDLRTTIDGRIDNRISSGGITGKAAVWNGTKYVNAYPDLLSRKTLLPFQVSPVNGWQFASGFPSGYFQVGENIFWIQLACYKPNDVAFTNLEPVITLPFSTTASFFGTTFENTIPRINGALVQAQNQGGVNTAGVRWALTSTFVVTA